jgi:diaminopimelate decarboxylase
MLAADFEPADAIRNAWDSVKRAAESANASQLLKDITLLLEPGRSIIADTGLLLTTVRNKKERPVAAAIEIPNSKFENDVWLLTDAGFNILLSMVTYNWYYHLISASRAGDEHNFPYKLAGPLCDGGDVYFDVEGEGRLPDHRELPDKVELGEILALLNCGAYTLAQASQYNGRFLPAVVLISKDGTPQLIRKRDAFTDLVNNDI